MGLSNIRRAMLMVLLAGLLGPAAFAADGQDPAVEEPLIREAGHTHLDEFKWTHRPIVVFADNPNDPRFKDQISMIEKQRERLAERDVVVLTDTAPSVLSPVREQLRPRGFMMVVMTKDGTIIVRKPFPLSVREITRSIDKLPARKREVEERRGANAGN